MGRMTSIERTRLRSISWSAFVAFVMRSASDKSDTPSYELYASGCVSAQVRGPTGCKRKERHQRELCAFGQAVEQEEFIRAVEIAAARAEGVDDGQAGGGEFVAVGRPAAGFPGE